VRRGFGLGRPSVRQYLETFIAMSKKVLVEYSRYPIAFIALFVQIFLIILLFIITSFAFQTPGTGQAQITLFAGMMAYGFVTNIILSFTLWEIGFSIREEQVRGTLESLYLSPTNKFSNLLSRIFAILVWTAAISIGGLLLVSGVVGGLPVNDLGKALFVLLLTTTGFLGFGFIFAGITIRLKETAQTLVNGVQFFFMIFSAQIFPFAVLPDWIRNNVSRWLPVSYCVDLFRTTLLGIAPELLPGSVDVEYVIVILFGIISPIVGYFYYNWIDRKARSEGTLGEY
jgi:ABC-2 type transport system permease protein